MSRPFECFAEMEDPGVIKSHANDNSVKTPHPSPIKVKCSLCLQPTKSSGQEGNVVKEESTAAQFDNPSRYAHDNLYHNRNCHLALGLLTVCPRQVREN